MGKFSKIWNRSKDGANHEERSFVRYAIVSTVIFLLFICVVKRDNLFRWIEAGITIHRQEKQMEFYDADIARLKEELNSLTTDKDTLEKFAREKFLFAEPGEDVYVQE
jgi:cell division protein FtsB